MKVLSVNSGSASLKFKLFEMPEEKLITSGVFERIGEDKSFYIIDGVKKIKNIRNHRDAIITLIDELVKNDSIDNLDEIEAVGHRVVHGGPHFTKSALVNDDVLKEIEKCIPLAPLHNGANLDGINAFMKALPHSKNVVVFDTAFNQSMDEVNYLYAVPYEWYEKYHVRKYGFHGISYNYLTNRLNEILKKKILGLLFVI